MIPVTSFRDRDVALFGLGGSGLVTAQALIAGGARVTAFDDSPASVAKAQAAGIPTGDLRALDWSTLAALVLAPGVPLTHPKPHWSVELAKGAGVEVIGDIELFVRERRAHAPGAPLVAITGTNGKSTTTALIHHILKHAGLDAQIGGNFGPAILSLDSPAPDRVHVIECSSYQIDLAPSLDPTVGILLNLSPDHLDRHGDMQHYAEVKQCLVAGVEVGGTAVVGVDDEWSLSIADRLDIAGRKLVRISVLHGLDDGICRDGDALLVREGGRTVFTVPLAGIGSLRGAHNAQNAAAAFAAVSALGLASEVIVAGIRSFPGLAHRMEEVRTIGKVLFVNDSKATNADATERALLSFEDIYWILGGKPKAGGIEPLRALFSRVRKAYLIGEAAEAFAATLGDTVPFEMCGTLEAAIPAAARDAAASEAGHPVVLLSPACASFDQFPNFEVRGDRFRTLVQALTAA